MHFKESDFLTDSYFLEWVYRPSKELEAYWQEVITTVPQQRENIANARLYLQSTAFVTHTPTDETIDASWERHLDNIQQLTETKPVLRRVLLRVAAVLTGILIIAGAWFMLHSRGEDQMVASTGFGELKHVLLPDGSWVDLNANSKITYKNREVWLEGEAFFDVKQLSQQFLVHTKDLTVTVLGTVFDIRQRRSKTEIVLQSGKIKLSFKNSKAGDIIMNPGQLVSYNREHQQSETISTSPEKFSAWKNQRLILMDPKVSDILIYLEDNFGKKIIMEDPELNNRMVNGPILISSLDDALFVLSTVLNTEIVKRDSTTIVMRSRGDQ
ncbi:FecR family protein [Chitinophaga sancti]|uniref:FecR domain-containing protein n=2 Tax=Chitinophaga sancti TaxID=1004 RepID=A0A1K1SWM4_9BACT|nr:FecR domain-containing protein [Chitinophaga sancti]WQG90551.1 FecR domain-containing protein [Chitinophaga sancti]SFW88253.1 FecR family protein [Chitinophaga sancti]